MDGPLLWRINHQWLQIVSKGRASDINIYQINLFDCNWRATSFPNFQPITMEHCLFSCTVHFDLLKFWQMGIGLNCYNSDKNYLCLQLWSMMVCCIEYNHRNGSIELEWVIHNSPLYQTHSQHCLYHHHNSHHQQMKDCYNLKLWNKWNLHWGNTVALGRMYWSILFSFWGIEDNNCWPPEQSVGRGQFCPSILRNDDNIDWY